MPVHARLHGPVYVLIYACTSTPAHLSTSDITVTRPLHWQEGENLQIVDVHTSAVISVSKTEFATPAAFIFLYENQLFLTFRKQRPIATPA